MTTSVSTDFLFHGATIAVSKFIKHRFLSYQGYAFPWYVTLIWITFFVLGLWYLIDNILLNDAGPPMP